MRKSHFTTSKVRALVTLAVVLPGCMGHPPATTGEALGSVVPAVRAADYVFGQHGIPVNEVDEVGGHLRSGLFDPHQRWGGLTGERVTCGLNTAGVDFVHDARALEMEVRIYARQVPGVAEEQTEITVWGVGAAADVDGRRRDCALVDEYRDDLARAIIERAEQTAVRF